MNGDIFMKFKVAFILGAFVFLKPIDPVFAYAEIIHITRGDIVSDEDASLLKGTPYVPVRKFVTEIKGREDKDLEKVEILNLEGSLLRAKGIRCVMDEVLPRLPHLKILDISYTGLDNLEDISVVLDILRQFPHLEFLYAQGNDGLTQIPLSLISQSTDNQSLLEDLTSKVIIFPSSIASDEFSTPELSSYKEWNTAHKRFYKLWEQYNSSNSREN